MSEVEKMIVAAAKAMIACDDEAWNALSAEERILSEVEAEGVLKSLGLPLETLAALKAGAWKAVPLVQTDDMMDAIDDAVDCFYNPEGVWGAALSIAPSKPEDEE